LVLENRHFVYLCSLDVKIYISLGNKIRR